MFSDELPPEAKDLEVDEAITNKESTKDSDYEKYTKKAADQLAKIKDPEKNKDYLFISRMRFEQFEQEDEKAR
jgi:hypothetical protein